MFRSALYSPLAPAFRSRECHNIRPCTVQSLPLPEACLRNYRTICVRTHMIGENCPYGSVRGVPKLAFLPQFIMT